MAARLSSRLPELDMLAAIPNGQMRRGQALEPGIQKGYPDLFLAVPRGPHHGLFVELKVPGGRVRSEQMHWLERLAAHGYVCTVCYGAMDALVAICEYLEINHLDIIEKGVR
jgi:hypothetical protein